MLVQCVLRLSQKAPLPRRLLFNVKGEASAGKIASLIGLIVVLVIWIYLVPIVVDAVQDTNTTGWTFTGHEGALAIFLLMPFIFIIGGIIYFVKELLS
jgi:hypothetical protein